MWTVTVRKDPDKPDVGEATAVWHAGQPDEFTFSARGQRGEGDYDRFVAAAYAAREARASDRDIEAAMAGELAELLNAEEA